MNAPVSSTSAAPPRLVVMGVSGCGKSTLGEALAQALGVTFVEGDAFHPRENVARMAAGLPLDDEHRRGWLDALAAQLAAAFSAGEGMVLTCSALKRRYRERLRQGAPDLRFVWLHGAPALLSARLHARRSHYMPASLLPSQLAALEPPGADEPALAFDIDTPPAELLQRVLQALGRRAVA